MAHRGPFPLPDLTGSPVINTTGVELPVIADALVAGSGREDMGIVDAIREWHREVTDPHQSRSGTLYDRDRYTSPTTYFGKVRTARHALTDDVVGGAADGTEALAIQRVEAVCYDRQQDDIWNQIVADLNLNKFMRQMWRTVFTDSAAVIGSTWTRKTYTVNRRTPNGNKSRKVFRDLEVPEALTLIDTTKVAPVGTLLFGRERLAYLATPEEAVIIDQILNLDPQGRPLNRPVGQRRARQRGMTWPIAPSGREDLLVDADIVKALITQKYWPNMIEQAQLKRGGVTDFTRMYLMHSRNVVRHTRTKPDHEPFPEVRLESVFELLDLKGQLRQADRAVLIGAAKFIVLITKGSDKDPGTQAEVDALKANAHQIAQVPVMVGDARLKVEIITPKTDFTLDRDKWATIDTRLFARAWGTFVPTGTDQEDPVKLGLVIGSGLEANRAMQAQTIEDWLFQQIRDRNPEMEERAELDVLPQQIRLTFDNDYAALVMQARERRDVSRQTYLQVLKIDQQREAINLEREAEEYDETFQTFNPYGPQPNQPDGQGVDPERRANQRSAGRAGGRRGGAAPGTGQGKAPRVPGRRSGGRREALRPSAAELEDMSRDELIDEAKDYRIKGRHQMRREDLITAITAAADADEHEDDSDD